MKYKFHEGQRLFMGRKPVYVTELREFYETPSYRVEWYDKENNICAGIMKEEELDYEAW